jgi:hypothetical protein
VYVLLNNCLFCRHTNGMLLQCVGKSETKSILVQFNDGAHLEFHSSGHFASKATVHKILHYGFYWPILFHDSFTFVRLCDCRQ